MELSERIPTCRTAFLDTLTLADFALLNKPTTKDKLKIKYDIMKSFCQTNKKTKGTTKRIYFYTNDELQCIQSLPKTNRGFIEGYNRY
jgi:hypothetical protein